MKVKLSPKVRKYVDGLNQPLQGRIRAALLKLEQEPPQGDIKAMGGKDGFRLRVGGYRILFDMTSFIYVYGIGLRGQIYKKR